MSEQRPLSRILYDSFNLRILQAHSRACKIRDTGMTHDQYADACFAEFAPVYEDIADAIRAAEERAAAPSAVPPRP